MKKILASFLAMMLMVSTAFGSDRFYQTSSGQWDIYGHAGSDTLNPACIMQTNWTGNSRLMVIQDLADGELYIHFSHSAWNIDGPYKTRHALEIRFFSGSRTIKVLEGSLVLENNSTISVRSMKQDTFYNPFMEADRMVFVMPGNVPDITVGLRGTRDAVEHSKMCVRAAGNAKLTFPKRGGQDT